MSLSYQQQASRDGYQHGKADAAMIEWTPELVQAYRDGECHPNPPLSGEWGDGLLPTDLRERYSVSGMDDEDALLILDEVCSAYEGGYYEGWIDRATEDAEQYIQH